MPSESSGEAIRDRLRMIKNTPPEYQGEESDFIKRHLDHGDPVIRTLAVECPWDFPDTEFADTVLSMAQNDPEESVRTSAIKVLGRYMYEGDMEMYDLEESPLEDPYVEPVMTTEQYKQMRDFLVATYQDPRKSLDERRFALEAVSFLSSDEVRQLIREAYASEQKQMRISMLFYCNEFSLRRSRRKSGSS